MFEESCFLHVGLRSISFSIGFANFTMRLVTCFFKLKCGYTVNYICSGVYISIYTNAHFDLYTYTFQTNLGQINLCMHCYYEVLAAKSTYKVLTWWEDDFIFNLIKIWNCAMWSQVKLRIELCLHIIRDLMNFSSKVKENKFFLCRPKLFAFILSSRFLKTFKCCIYVQIHIVSYNILWRVALFLNLFLFSFPFESFKLKLWTL